MKKKWIIQVTARGLIEVMADNEDEARDEALDAAADDADWADELDAEVWQPPEGAKP